MEVQQLSQLILWLLMLIPVISWHEAVRAWAAKKLGDPTAEEHGRLTLNPIVHVDPIGTLLIPGMILLMTGGRYVLGWGQQVPIDPSRLRNRRLGMLGIVGAGLAANLVLSVAALILALIFSVMQSSWTSLVMQFAQVSTVLALWSLLPIPPMDGWRAVQVIFRLPESIEWYGGGWGWPLLFIGLINFTPLPCVLSGIAGMINYEILIALDWIRAFCVIG